MAFQLSGQPGRGFLLATVFTTGASIMAIEMSASRLVAPYFGTSLLVWTNIIGLIMASLSLGYYVGGRLADRRPEPDLLYKIILGSGGLIFLIPLISSPVMSRAASGTVGMFIGSLVTVVLLFALPFTLLGMVSPFVIKLASSTIEDVGSTAGSIYALSTVGSILGTYLPALLFIPLLGTRRTILLFAACLVLVGILGLLRRVKSPVTVIPLFAFALAIIGPPGDVKAVLTERHSKLVEKESLYNYIQVQQRKVPLKEGGFRNRNLLILNEGYAVHSIYDENSPYFPYVGSVWDYLGLCTIPLARPSAKETVNVCIVGLAAGTISTQMFHTYGDVLDLKIDGVEIDPEIIKLGRQYFDMNQKGLNAVAADGRIFLQGTDQKYDVIITDAYRQPYIPFHLTTEEYFRLNAEHLKENGLVAINVGTLSDKTELFQRIASTIKKVFPAVEYIPVSFPGALFTNFVILASAKPLNSESLDPAVNPLLKHLEGRGNWLVGRGVFQKARMNWKTFKPTGNWQVLTDDKAPVEFLTDWLIVKYILSGKAQKAMASEQGRPESGKVKATQVP